MPSSTKCLSAEYLITQGFKHCKRFHDFLFRILVFPYFYEVCKLMSLWAFGIFLGQLAN